MFLDHYSLTKCVFSITFLLLHLLTCLKIILVMIGHSINLISDLEKVIYFFFSKTFNYSLLVHTHSG